MWEYALTLLRLDERARAYFTITIVNVLVDDPGHRLARRGRGPGRRRDPARQLRHRRRLPASGCSSASAAGSASSRDRALLRRMLRFGLPTMPAELTLYSLNFIDRILIVRLAGLAEAGLYALAIKFAQGINVLARGFQLAFPPLAYSIADDDEARRAYSADRHLVRGRLRLRRRRPLAALAPDRRPARRARVLRGATRRSACSRPASRSTRSTWCWSSSSAAPGRTERSFPATRRRDDRQRRPQPGPDPAARDRRRRASPSSAPTWSCVVLDVRVHPPPVPGAVRVGAVGAARRQ